jgi:hypothetical protein
VSDACLTLPLTALSIAPPDCNTRLGTVTRRRQSRSSSLRTSLARLLASSLLLFILYSTTLEAAHKHGRFLKTEGSEQSLSVSNPRTPSNVASQQFGCSECLICQLQKSFSATVVTARSVSSGPNSPPDLLITAAITFKSHTNAPQKGRAPPFTS